jgi:hypothetical protein
MDKPGAIILSPPHDEKYPDLCDVTKFHICCDCYSFCILQIITNPYHYLKGIDKSKKLFEVVKKRRHKMGL